MYCTVPVVLVGFWSACFDALLGFFLWVGVALFEHGVGKVQWARFERGVSEIVLFY